MNQAHSAIVGRGRELETLRRILTSKRAEFLAVYGRRRIGKTFLIRTFFEEAKTKSFIITGEKAQSMRTQISTFQRTIENDFFEGIRGPDVKTWREGFMLLISAVRQAVRKDPDGVLLLFMDELPWLHTPKSGFVEALGNAWNTELSTIPQVKLVVSGSAASWMLKKIVMAKGSLHNRLTETIKLAPFSFGESKALLLSKGMNYSEEHVLELFLAFGGVPYYLDMVRPGESPSQAISRLCFAGGALSDEFEKLFKSLFDDGNHHEKIVMALAKKRRGLSRAELIDQTKFPKGGRIDEWLKELEAAGFIAKIPVSNGQRDTVCYRVIDEWTLFHLRWIAPAGTGLLGPSPQDDYFVLQRKTQAYESWSGHAFENACMKHIPQIKKALGISNMIVRASVWQQRVPLGRGMRPASSKAASGAQIDLVLDRDDGVTTLCEIKYYNQPFKVTASYGENLANKLKIYTEATHSRGSVFFVLVSPSGILENEYSRRYFARVVTAKDLFS